MRPPKAASPTNRVPDMIKPDAPREATCPGLSRSIGRWGAPNTEYSAAMAAGTLVPAGAAVPGVGYDAHGRLAARVPDPPSGPSRTAAPTQTASTAAAAAIEIVRLDAGTTPKSRTEATPAAWVPYLGACGSPRAGPCENP
jgi:hypothetical protein